MTGPCSDQVRNYRAKTSVVPVGMERCRWTAKAISRILSGERKGLETEADLKC
jgi:hypothetical protein